MKKKIVLFVTQGSILFQYIRKNCQINLKKLIFQEVKPDGYHYEMIRCKQCSLLYASEIYDEEFSNNLYEESDFYNTNEIQGLKKTYGNCISQALKNLENKESFWRLDV